MEESGKDQGAWNLEGIISLRHSVYSHVTHEASAGPEPLETWPSVDVTSAPILAIVPRWSVCRR